MNQSEPWYVRTDMDATSEPSDVAGETRIDHGFDLVEYAQGTAPVETQHLVEHHLDGCRPCRDIVDELRVTLLLLEMARPQARQDSGHEDSGRGQATPY
jgi:putative zinc finger protein